MKEINEDKIRKLLTPINNLILLTKCLKESNDENIYLALKNSNLVELSKENCEKIIELFKEFDKNEL